MNTAPIGISTYIRLGHLQQTIETLRNNHLAPDSDLYIFSDGARVGDEERVAAVRSYLEGIDGFRRVEVLERPFNNRMANNRVGIRQLLEDHGRLIFLEEDIVTAPHFLTFMNTALEKYRDRPEVFSVCGYSPPIGLPKDYPYDTYVLPRFSAWGFGTWRDRFTRLQMKLDKTEVLRHLANPLELWRFANGGWDMLPMLAREVNGKIDALDVKIFFQQYRSKMVTIYPARSLVLNIGHDGTGIHCGKTDRFDVELDQADDRVPGLIDNTLPDPQVLRANRRFRSGDPISRFTALVRAVTELI